jgi:hypothetical protein
MIERLEDKAPPGTFGLESLVVAGPATIPLMEALGIDVPGITTTDARSSAPTGWRFSASNFDARSMTAGRVFRSDIGSSLLDSHFRDPALAINLSASHAADTESTTSHSDRTDVRSEISVRDDLQGLSDKLVDSRLPSALADLWITGSFSLGQPATERQDSARLRGPSAGSDGESGSSHATGSAAPAVPDLGLSSSVLGTPLMKSETFSTSPSVAVGPRAAASEGDPPVNKPPTVGSDGFAVTNPGSVTITTTSVLANATDPEGGPLTATLGTAAANGTVTTNADGSVTYTPNAGFSGIDHIGYTVTDDQGLSTSGEIEVAVFLSVTDPLGGDPWAQAAPDGYTFEQASELPVLTNGVLANDSLSDESFTAALVDAPSYGTVSLNGDGTFTYTPNDGSAFTGSDSFTYQLVGGMGTTSNMASVSIHVVAAAEPLPHGASLSSDIYNFDPASEMSVMTMTDGVLANDTLGSGAYRATLVDPPSHGTVSLNGDGTFTYTPTAGAAFVGSDTFTYRVINGLGYSSDPTTATILVNAPPTRDPAWAAAGDDAYSFLPADSFTIEADGVMANDSFSDDPFAAQLVDAPAYGAVSLNGDGTFTYTPNDGSAFTGTDTFTYQLVDGAGTSSNTATVTLHVNSSITSPGRSAAARSASSHSAFATALPRVAMSHGPNHSPVANPDPGSPNTYYWVIRGGKVTANVLSNDWGPDGGPQPLRVGSYIQPAVGTLVWNATPGVFTYTAPTTGAAAGAAFTYKAFDGLAYSGDASVSFYFSNTPNVRPSFNSLSNQTVLEDSGPSSVTITGVKAGDADTVGQWQTVTFTATSSDPSIVPNPTITGSGATRTLTFAPAPNRYTPTNSPVTITVTAKDDGGTWNGGQDTFTRSFTITVTPVNDAPCFDPIASKTYQPNSGMQSIPITGINAGPYETGIITLSAWVSASNTTPPVISGLTVNPDLLTNSGQSTLSFNVSGATGAATIKVKAQDDGGTANGGVDTCHRTFDVSVRRVVTISRYPGETDNASEIGPRSRSFLVDRGSEDLSKTLIVAFHTVGDGGDHIATLGSDYTLTGSTVQNNEVTIPAGTPSVALTVSPIPDALEEGTEQVVLQLAAALPGRPSYAWSDKMATIAIEDKPFVWMSQADPEAVEGGANTGLQALQGSVRFCRSGSVGEVTQPLTVRFATVNPPPTSTAIYGGPPPGTDYGFTNALTSTSFTIRAGLNCDDLVVAPYWDSLVEGAEQAQVLLSDATNDEYIADRRYWNGRYGYATVNIEDTNPPKVWMSQADDSAEEGGYDANDVTRMGSVRFHRNGNPSQPLTVNFTTSGTATYGLTGTGDYGFTNAAPSSITFPAGWSSVDLVIAPRFDNLWEPTETATINLASGSGYTVDWARTVTSVWVNIINVDQLPRVQSLSVSPSKPGISENGGTATISATLSNASAYAVTIPLTFPTGTGLATPGVDYTTSASSITIPAGSTTGSVTLTALPDSLIEGNETVRVRITTATNATVPAPLEADTTILDTTERTYLGIIDVDLDGDGSADTVPDDEDLYLAINNDDDDGDGVADLNNLGPLLVSDDELLLVRITILSNGSLAGHALTATGVGVRVWTDALKSARVSTESPLELNSAGSQTAVVELYVEGLVEGDGFVTFAVQQSDTVGNNPNGLGQRIVGELVFTVLSPLKAAWISRIRKEKLQHRDYLYYEPSGIKALFATLEARAKSLSFGPNYNVFNATAAYESVTGTVLVNNVAQTAPLTAVHETVHAVDDVNDWYITGYTTNGELEKAEALAYGIEAILTSTVHLKSFEDGVNSGTINATNALNTWKLVIAEVNSILNAEVTWNPNGPLPPGQQTRALNAADLSDIKAKLGVSLGFNVLMPMYQQLLNRKGINVTLTMDIGNVHLAEPFRGN